MMRSLTRLILSVCNYLLNLNPGNCIKIGKILFDACSIRVILFYKWDNAGHMAGKCSDPVSRFYSKFKA